MCYNVVKVLAFAVLFRFVCVVVKVLSLWLFMEVSLVVGCLCLIELCCGQVDSGPCLVETQTHTSHKSHNSQNQIQMKVIMGTHITYTHTHTHTQYTAPHGLLHGRVEYNTVQP